LFHFSQKEECSIFVLAFVLFKGTLKYVVKSSVEKISYEVYALISKTYDCLSMDDTINTED